MIEDELLTEARHALLLARYSHAEALCQQLRRRFPARSQAGILLVRALLLQGHFTRAEAACREVLAQAQEGQLWLGWLQIYTRGETAPAIAASAALLRKLPASSPLVPRAQVFLGKALAIEVEWGLQSASRLIIARDLLTVATGRYRAEGDVEETVRTLLSLGQFSLLEAGRNPARARALFQRACASARAAEQPVLLAEALVRLAELDFDAQPTPVPAAPHSLEPFPLYRQALALYEQAGYATGLADILCSLGSHCVAFGLNGAALLTRALEEYQRVDSLLGTHQVLKTLGQWYTQQGELPEAFACHQRNTTVTAAMGFPAGQAVAWMGLGDYYHRTADYARALAAYEQAEQMTSLRSVGVMVQLVLANLYLSMRRPEQAERVCRAAIQALAPGGAGANLSLARFILGNILLGAGDSAAAIAAWQTGVAEDEARQDALNLAKKLQSIAQATVLQHYRPQGPPVPADAFEEAMALYARSLTLLEADLTPQAQLVIANTYQYQGHICVTCGRHAEALLAFVRAIERYSALQLGMQAAITSVMAGRLHYEAGVQGQSGRYGEALRFYEQARHYFQRTRMLDLLWKVLFALALVAFQLGRLAATGVEQEQRWLAAASLFEEAEESIGRIRAGFLEADPMSTQLVRLGMTTDDKELVYIDALLLHYYHLHSSEAALHWLERLKGRSFLDELALTPLHAPTGLPPDLCEQEQALLQALRQASSQQTLLARNEQLNQLWSQMLTCAEAEEDPAVAEYVALRRGTPASWQDILWLLDSEG